MMDFLVPPDEGREGLIADCLKKKVKRPLKKFKGIAEINDIWKIEPWDAAAIDNRTNSQKWIFSLNTEVTNSRTTKTGYWNQIGTMEFIGSNGMCQICKRTFAFYKGIRPCGKLMDWRLDEYCLQPHERTSAEECTVLCRLYLDQVHESTCASSWAASETDGARLRTNAIAPRIISAGLMPAIQRSAWCL